MKKFVAFLLLIISLVPVRAQVNLSVIKKVLDTDMTPVFLGIPVDGTKMNMIRAIEAKGFEYDRLNECLTGEFNGKNAYVFVHSNHDNVDRIMVSYSNISKKQIRDEYNHLLRQFKNNSKYIELLDNEEIPENENIPYEITLNDKTYAAAFYYLPQSISVKELANEMKALILAIRKGDKVEGLEELGLDMDAFSGVVDASEEEWKELIELSEDDWIDVVKHLFFGGFQDNTVWFRICEGTFDDFSICIYYDNERNKANGEDL